MKKIEIIGLLRDSKKIVERLQRRGIVELCDTQGDALIRTGGSTFVSQFERSRASCENAIAIIKRFAPEKTSLLAGFTTGKRDMEIHALGKKAMELEKTMQAAYEVIAQQKQITDSEAECGRLQILHDALVGWFPLDIPLNFGGTEQTACFIGTLGGSWDGARVAQLLESGGEEKALDGVQYEIVTAYPEITNLVFFCHKTEKAALSDLLRANGFTPLTDASKLTATEQAAAYEKAIADERVKIANAEKRIKTLAAKKEDFEFFVDYLTLRCDKYAILDRLAMTEKTIVITGYIPEKYAQRLIDELERHYTVAARTFDPDEDEDVPVKLENNGFAAPVEGITEMYALPNKHDIDPSPVFAFFYYFFFGMMLSDAGYGLVMMLITAIALKKFKVSDSMRRSLKMFFYCGISTVVWGALFGSWFGDAIPVIAEQFFGKQITVPCWFEPIDDPIRLLLYSFGFGIVHLFVGLGVNFYILWKDGRKLDALCDTIPVYLTILGVLPFGAGILMTVPPVLTKIGGPVALVGAALIILTSGRSSKNIVMKFFGGLYGLYNVATGYLGDILSYSRLLALGLATGSIAGVINMIGTLSQNPVLKAIMFIIVFCVAHIMNILINLLGAYVHTSRLQFVEMFSKFYEGGGRAFSPLSTKTKYMNFTEDQSHE